MSSSLRKIIITGANRGLGYALAKNLYQSSHESREIIMACRDETLGKKAYDTIMSTCKNSINKLHLESLDLEDTFSIDAFCRNVMDKYANIDILVNNAGIGFKSDMHNPGGQKIADYELAEKTIKVDFLNMVELTERLLPLISDDGKIINITGIVGKLQFQGKPLQTKLSNPDLTSKDLIDLAHSFLNFSKTGQHKQQGFCSSAYFVSKCLLNPQKVLGHYKALS